MWSLSLVTPPTAEPLDLAEVAQHSRLSPEMSSAQGERIAACIQAARQNCETFTGRQLITASWELWLDSWMEPGIYEDGSLYIPKAPIDSATVVITYLDAAGATQTWAAAKYVDKASSIGKPRIFPAYGEVWPTLLVREAAVKIAFNAGYGAAASAVPGGLRSGMLLHIGELYERREEQTVGTIVSPNLLTAGALWAPFRIF